MTKFKCLFEGSEYLVLYLFLFYVVERVIASTDALNVLDVMLALEAFVEELVGNVVNPGDEGVAKVGNVRYIV